MLLRGCKAFILFLSVMFFTISIPHAAETWVLLPEPTFMGHAVSRPIAGAKQTVFATVRVTGIGIEFPTDEEWREYGASEESVMEATRKLASEWLRQAKVEIVRDKKKVAQYALLRSDTLPVCSVVFTSDFRRRFAEVFGQKFRVVIPNRNTVFVFAALVADDSLYGPKIIAAWKSAAPKVSLEVFECEEAGLRAVGAFEEP